MSCRLSLEVECKAQSLEDQHEGGEECKYHDDELSNLNNQFVRANGALSLLNYDESPKGTEFEHMI